MEKDRKIKDQWAKIPRLNKTSPKVAMGPVSVST